MSLPRTISSQLNHDGDESDSTNAPIDLPRIERAVREILFAIGENPDREGLLRTPHRVARAYAELMAGLHDDPKRHLRTVFHERYDEVVLLRQQHVNQDKHGGKTIEQLRAELSAKTGENVVIKRFARFEVGA